MFNKYRAKKTYLHKDTLRVVSKETPGAIKFDSQGEASRYCELRTLEKIGKISALELQPEFCFIATPNSVTGMRREVYDNHRQKLLIKKLFSYKADFEYSDLRGRKVIEDFKGMRTPVYKLKAKMFQACFPEYIFRETGSKK